MQSRELYIYEILHTLSGEVMLLNYHIERANRAALNIFGIDNFLNIGSLKAEIENFLTENRAPKWVSVHLRLELYNNGTHSLSLEEISIYSGYTLRCYEPCATLVHINIPYESYSTGAREQISHIERIEAEKLGCDIALRCNSSGEVTAANNSPIFGVKNGTLYNSISGVESVEQAMVMRVASNSFKVANQPIMAHELSTYDELFYVDHFGITAIKRVGKRLYMNAVASTLSKIISNAN